jgi:flagellar protein FliS
MTSVRHLQAYKENQMTTADPGTILLLLYQGAIDSVNGAVENLAAGNMAEKGRCILRAHDIITQFLISLDHEVAGEVAKNLDSLYRYMLDQLLAGNVNNDAEPMKRVSGLLATLKQGWESAVVDQRKRMAQGAA